MNLLDKGRVHEETVTNLIMAASVIQALFFNTFFGIFLILLAVYFKVDAMLHKERIEALIKKQNKQTIGVDNQDNL